MTGYLLTHPWGTVCSVKHYKHEHIFTLPTAEEKSRPVKLNYICERYCDEGKQNLNLIMGHIMDRLCLDHRFSTPITQVQCVCVCVCNPIISVNPLSVRNAAN